MRVEIYARKIVAMDMALRFLLLPLLILLDDAFGKSKAKIMGDNRAMLRVLKTGRIPQRGTWGEHIVSMFIGYISDSVSHVSSSYTSRRRP